MPAAKGGTTTGSNGNGRVIDLDAARVARAEVEKEPVEVRIGGKMFKLPPELPAEFALLSAEERGREALYALLGKHAKLFFGADPSLDDVNELVKGVSSLYGLDEGE